MTMRLTTIIISLLIGLSAWAGKGDDVLARVKRDVAPDARQVVFDLKYDDATGRLTGVTSEATAHDAAVKALRDAGLKVTDSVEVYPASNMGLVRIPVASLRTRAAHAGEMATQAVMGTPVRILENVKGWMRVQTPDGYIAYVPDSSISPMTPTAFAAWQANDNRMVNTSTWQTHAFTTPEATGPREVVTDIVLNAIVTLDPTVEPVGERVAIVLPDGRRGWVNRSEFTPIAEWADQAWNVERILDTAYSMEGTPYLWGGTSNKSVDCSGLAKISYLSNGIILRRDASQQALTGKRLEASAWPTYQAGDLLFFGSNGRVTHVAIYDHDGWYVHSSGRVKRNTLDPSAQGYLYSPLHAVRIHGSEGSDGIVRVIDHPWFFKK